MDPDLRVAQESARRWQTRQVEREEQRSAIEEGLIASVEPPESIQKRLDRLAAAAVGRKGSAGGPGPRAGRPQAGLVETIGLERVLGKADFLGMDFLETALAVSRFVGRINLRTRPGRTEGFGTGFMVSPRLLLTNNHVLRTKGDALYSEVEFDYQYDRHDRLLPVAVYGLEPETFFLTSRELDFTLVAVRESSLNGIGIGRYGWSPLIGAEGKCLLGDPLNVVQHPKGEAKQIVLRSNQLVDLFGDFAHYVADTEPGSSGSPIYNDEWEVVCLHHSGVPKTEDGNLVAKDGSVWRQGMDPDDLEWVANEGVRMSSIVAHLKKERLTGEQAKLREELLNSEHPIPWRPPRWLGRRAASRTPRPRAIGLTRGRSRFGSPSTSAPPCKRPVRRRRCPRSRLTRSPPGPQTHEALVAHLVTGLSGFRFQVLGFRFCGGSVGRGVDSRFRGNDGEGLPGL